MRSRGAKRLSAAKACVLEMFLALLVGDITFLSPCANVKPTTPAPMISTGLSLTVILTVVTVALEVCVFALFDSRACKNNKAMDFRLVNG